MEKRYNGKYRQTLSVTIKSDNHDSCLAISKPIKQQCEAWDFCVEFTEYKSARKGPVLTRDLMIYQEAYGDDIIIFKEAIRRICFHYDLYCEPSVSFTDRGSIPVD